MSFVITAPKGRKAAASLQHSLPLRPAEGGLADHPACRPSAHCFNRDCADNNNALLWLRACISLGASDARWPESRRAGFPEGVRVVKLLCHVRGAARRATGRLGRNRSGKKTMTPSLKAALIDAAADVIAQQADMLTALDQAIGDGDHGINMKRGFEAIRQEKEAIAALADDEALQKAGMTLVMKVGGASGPLYGSLLMGMAKAAKAGHDLEGQLAEGIAMVKKRGKSDVGAKTMLDVLVPVHAALKDHGERPAAEAIAAVRRTAEAAREATRDMLATRGRASFLGARSVGHYDPGATSSQLLISTLCDLLERQA
jgi:dihydroxyacetone kinase-like protein